MPRIRTIKPQIWSDTRFARLSVGAKLTFIGLITQADDEGRLEYHPRILKATLFPLNRVQLINWLGEIEEQGLICRYSIKGNDYIQIKKWSDHQKISHPVDSKIPKPPESSRRIYADKDKEKDKDIYSAIAQKIYDDYPRKRDRKKAIAQIKARLKEGESEGNLSLAAKNYKRESKLENREERFIKHAATFFGRDKPYEDYIEWSPPQDKICGTCKHRVAAVCQVDGHTYTGDTPCQTGEWEEVDS
jgi:hypothetical protein